MAEPFSDKTDMQGAEQTLIREKIVEDKRKRRRNVIHSVCMALLAGAAAGLVFWLLMTFLPNGPFREEAALLAETEAESEASPETEAAEISAPEEPQLEAWLEENGTPWLESAAVQILEEQSTEEEQESEIQDMYRTFAAQSLATVELTQQGTDWLQESREDTETTWAVLVEKTSEHLLFLTDEAAISDMQTMSLTMGTQTSRNVRIYVKDTLTGMTLLEVPASSLEVSDDWQAAQFGSSHQLKAGETLVAVGSPLGVVGSINSGTFCMQENYIELLDMTVTLLYTNMIRTDGTGLLLNSDGQIVGYLTDLHHSGLEDFTAAIGISDLSGTLTKMEQGETPAYLGVRGQRVPETVQNESGVPAGFYVTEVLPDGAAFAAGMQPGDIITTVGESRIGILHSLNGALLQYKPGDAISVTIERWNRGNYEELELSVVLDDGAAAQ